MRTRRAGPTVAFFALLFSPLTAWAEPLIIDGSLNNNTCPGGIVRDGGRACEYGGTHTFDYVELKNNATLYVTKFNGVNKNTTGNLVLRATGLDPTGKFSIKVDKTSRVQAKGAGYQGKQCDNGPGPSYAPLSGGRGGCSVYDSGGGGGHFGPGGRGTKDNPGSFPAGYEEDCVGQINGAGTACVSNVNCRNNDGLPTVAGQSFYHSIYDVDFGAAGGDKGCRDGDGFGAGDVRAGSGGGRIVLFAANAAQSGVLWIEGRVTADGNRGCASGNDSAGGGAGGTILLVGDTVKIAGSARISSHGGRGGDSQPKCLPCTTNANCGAGQTCQPVTDPQTGVTQNRCGPCNCTPCTNNSQCNAALGQTCKNLGFGNVCADANNQCTPIDPGDNEAECVGTQNTGTCDDCGGGGGGGIINVQSRLASIDPKAIFDVRGSFGGVCPICTGEAGGGIGELQLDSAYVGEICDGFDNDFNGLVDDNLPTLSCPDGSTPPSCVNGVPQTCPVNPATCTVPAKDARPRFALIVDTSGSMLNDVAGNPQFGDGSVEFPGVNTGNPSRLFIAKNAVSKVIAAFPESSYALARYYQDVGPNRSCQTASNFECAKLCCSYDDPTDNVPPPYPATYPDNQCRLSSLYPGAGYPNQPTFTQNISIGWATPEADCINYAGSCGPPRRGAQVLVGFDQPLHQYLAWLDHKETNFQETLADPQGNRCKGGDCELRGTGPTPLAGSLQAISDYLTPIIACDGAKACRKYSVILLTDGTESCQGNPVQEAAQLLQKGVNTYVIGFSVLPSERAQLNAIAAAGGTDAGKFTGTSDKAFFATTEEELANALAAIIAGSQVFEKCNGVDDNCNNLIDEGFDNKGAPCDNGKLGVCRVTGAYQCSADGSTTVCSVAGNPGPAPSAEVCNGLDDDCNGFVDDGLNCQGCIPLPEVCNGKDDDCDGQIDNVDKMIDVGQSCGQNIGQCKAGITTCVGGKLECTGAVGPAPEVCNGLDDDCDGGIDGMTRPCYSGPEGTLGVGACQAGNQKCNATAGGPESYGPCIGEVLPKDEVCDGLDNDCDGLVDEEISNNKGNKTGDSCCPYGNKCGVGVCTFGSFQCVGNAVVCTGGIGPTAEVCDELDNDCNGKADDLPGLGSACVQPGGCPGVLACNPETKQVVCASPTVPNPEICNGLDDNCNGQIDEEPAVSDNDDRIGKPCDVPTAPNDKGACKGGVTVCTNGSVVCDGSVKPSTEACNGLDDDCNGLIDDEAPCPPGSSCQQGQCVEPCKPGEFPCPGGFDCKGGFCFAISCDGVTCPDGKVCSEGKCIDGVAGAGGSGLAGAAGSSGGTTAGAGGSGGVGAGQAGTAQAGSGPAGAAGSGQGGTGPAGSSGGGGESQGGVFGLTTGGGGLTCAASPGSSPGAGTLLLALGALALRSRSARRGAQGGAR
ncbi:MAG: MopE-related protein [Myxococcales bacterium]|nr:MopE-related protein [Polyangiaceae bacterium]MDW8249566.1 MopE-related protein [Myxococcales bacterium]